MKHELGVLLLHVTQRFPGVELLLLQPDFLLLQCPVGIRLLHARLKLRPLRLGLRLKLLRLHRHLRSELLRLHRYLRSNSLPLQSGLMRSRLSGLPDLDRAVKYPFERHNDLPSLRLAEQCGKHIILLLGKH